MRTSVSSDRSAAGVSAVYIRRSFRSCWAHSVSVHDPTLWPAAWLRPYARHTNICIMRY